MNKGYMTIEARVIVPVIIFGAFFAILGLLIAYERGFVNSSEYERLYTIPLNNIRNECVEEYLSGADFEKSIVTGALDMKSSYSSHKASFEGTLRVIKDISVSCSREIDVREDRLRRWQLYDDTFEE